MDAQREIDAPHIATAPTRTKPKPVMSAYPSDGNPGAARALEAARQNVRHDASTDLRRDRCGERNARVVVGWARGNHTDVGDDYGDELGGYIATQERVAACLVERGVSRQVGRRG